MVIDAMDAMCDQNKYDGGQRVRVSACGFEGRVFFGWGRWRWFIDYRNVCVGYGNEKTQTLAVKKMRNMIEALTGTKS